MPGYARKDIVRQGEIGVYHTWSRCVQRAFLCGEDPTTGRNYEHRRGWIKSLLKYLASVFAVDVGNYTVLSNHQHLIVRTRPDISAAWSDEEVAWRWLLAWPSWRDNQWKREPTDEEIQDLLQQEERIPVLRSNLASLSWFMARWKEPVAKLANHESHTKGHFYEQRFGSRELLDESSALCCNVYLDLNQVKAGEAESLIQSDCSAIQDRMLAWCREKARESVEQFRASVSPEYELPIEQMEQLLTDCFLSPFGENGPILLMGSDDRPQMSNPAPATPVPPSDSGPPIETASIGATEDIINFVELTLPAEMTTNTMEAMPDAVDSNDSAEVPDQNPDEPTSDGGPDAQPQPENSKASTEATYFRHQRLQKRRKPRASDHCILGVSIDQYLGLAQWSADQLKAEIRHPPPAEWDAFLRKMGIAPSRWCDTVEHFGELFHRAVGHLDKVADAVTRAGRKWFQGHRACGDVFT